MSQKKEIGLVLFSMSRMAEEECGCKGRGFGKNWNFEVLFCLEKQ
jgi:hypothetical protein